MIHVNSDSTVGTTYYELFGLSLLISTNNDEWIHQTMFGFLLDSRGGCGCWARDRCLGNYPIRWTIRFCLAIHRDDSSIQTAVSQSDRRSPERTVASGHAFCGPIAVFCNFFFYSSSTTVDRMKIIHSAGSISFLINFLVNPIFLRTLIRNGYFFMIQYMRPTLRRSGRKFSSGKTQNFREPPAPV